MKLILMLLFPLLTLFANPLQESIDKAKPYSLLRLSKGVYGGNIVIDKPLTIIGKEKGVMIMGEGSGTTITITSSEVTLKNLTITHSGENFQSIDSAIKMSRCRACVIDGCTLRDTLYGIDMSMVSDSNITNNYITSNGKEVAFRGNALKLYYSSNNLFFHNTIQRSRDISLNYSHHNLFEKNRFIENRFAIHLSLSHGTVLRENFYQYNAVAIMVMGAKDTKVIGNQILSSKGASGIGVMVNGVENFRFEQNRVKFNAKGLYIDGGERGKGMKRYIVHNEISYNKEAIHFHQSIKDNTITHNKIVSNIEDIVKDLPSKIDNSNMVEYNYWDRYEGFDSNRDNIGDRPHSVYQYADRLWAYNNKIKFFYASPLMSLLNFMSELAPFIEPNLLIEDRKPVVLLE
jgi:nitrous oxidase accessory protein